MEHVVAEGLADRGANVTEIDPEGPQQHGITWRHGPDVGDEVPFEDVRVGQELRLQHGKKFSVPGKSDQQMLGTEMAMTETAGHLQRGVDDELRAWVETIEHPYLLRPRRT